MSKSMFNAPHFQTVEAAREYLEALRWGADRVCPHCGTVNESFATKKPGVYRCRIKECRKDFSVTTKSVMESSHIKLNIWLQAFFLMASSKKGISSHQLHRALGITYKSAWFLTHRIREAMRAGGLMPPMGSGGGVVEADETYSVALRASPSAVAARPTRIRFSPSLNEAAPPVRSTLTATALPICFRSFAPTCRAKRGS
jgi:transposase-like protein